MLKDGLVWLSGLAKADQKLGGSVLATDCGTPSEPPTCDTFTWFRGCLLLLDLRRGSVFSSRFQSPVGEDSDDLLKSIRDLFANSGSSSN